MKKAFKILLLVFVILIIILLYRFYFSSAETVVEKRDYIVIKSSDTVLRASGIVKPGSVIEIKSMLAEKVDMAKFAEGKEIKKDELLLKYNNSLAEIELEQAEASKAKSEASLIRSKRGIEQAKMALELAKIKLENIKEMDTDVIEEEIEQARLKLKKGKKDLDKYQHLYENGAIELAKLEEQLHQVEILESQLNILENRLIDNSSDMKNNIEEALKEVERAENNYYAHIDEYEVAKMSLEMAKKVKEKAETLLRQHFIYSPLDALIIDKSINSGEYAQPGQLLYRLASNDLLIKISPDERELRFLNKKLSAYISPEAYPEKKIEVKIEKIAPEIDQNRGTIDVYLKPMESNDFLIPNMAVSVEIIPESKMNEEIYIPEDYLLDGEKIFKYNNGKAILSDVKTAVSQINNVKIIEGVNPGDIILEPEGLEDGQEIELER